MQNTRNKLKALGYTSVEIKDTRTADNFISGRNKFGQTVGCKYNDVELIKHFTKWAEHNPNI